jgi:phage minor structural protein
LILYFADRKMNILGAASTSLSSGLMIISDEKDEVIGDSVNVFEAKLSYEEEGRKIAESYTAEGNYVLREYNGKSEFYTIISTEQSVANRTIEIYCEDAGLDLLNETAWAYTATEAHNIAWYINKFSEDTGFEIGINEIPTLTRKLSWDGTSTAAERLTSIATQFDNAEVSYSFEVKNMKIAKKYINIYKKRGTDNGVTFQYGKDISDITVTRSIENLATALEPTGGTPEGEDDPITLSGYKYDDGDIYISGKRLISRSATQKWSRYRYKDEPNQITGWLGPIINREWSYDTTSQSELCSRAVSHLKDIMEPEVNYEVEFVDFPDNVSIGDTIYICDHAGDTYLSARVLELKTSQVSGTSTATLGDYLITSSGISDKVQSLATQFAELASKRQLYTWIVYADDAKGTNITTEADGKSYMGVSVNHTKSTPDLSDPLLYTWNLVKGTDGSKGEDGKGVSKIQEQYYLSTSSTEQTGGSWSNTMPTWESGKYIWKRDYITYTDSSTATSTATLANALNSVSSDAATAVSTANTAKSTASAAKTTANTAKSTAKSASTTATAAKEDIDGILTEGAKTVDGAKITDGTITADKINVNDLFAQEITATGSITGATLKAKNSAGDETLEITSDGKIVMGTDAGIYLDKGDTAQPLISWSKSTTGEANVDIHNSDQMTIEVDNEESGIYFNIAGEDVGMILADGLYMNCHGPANRLENMYPKRPTSANLTAQDSKGETFQFKATSSMTEGKPAGDGHILHFEWDNKGGYDTQLALSNMGAWAQLRGMNAGTWQTWRYMPLSNFACMQLKQITGSVVLANSYGSAGLKFRYITYDISNEGFTSVTEVITSVRATEGLVCGQTYSFTNEAVNIYVWGDTNNEAVQMMVSLLIIGQRH